jgi:hypothetical protein
MSYEGFTQYICPVGHHYTVDSMVGYGGFDSKEEHIKAYSCPRCGAWPVYSNEVDETNGTDPQDPRTYPKEVIEACFYDVPQYDHRGNYYVTKDIRYKPEHPEQWRKVERHSSDERGGTKARETRPS